jgi:hypothetical protein
VDDFYRIQAQDAAALNQLNIMNNCDIGDEWQRQLLMRNTGQIPNPSINTRSRFLMPPGTYSSK